ncbi:cell division cycle protein 20 homolog B-like [Symphorus nematophorus]
MKFVSLFSILRLLRLTAQHDVNHVSYKRFRRRIIQRSSSEGPAASTPLATGWQCEASFEFDPVCQRLELDSPPRHHEQEHRVLPEKLQGSDESRHDLKPFAVLDEAPLSLEGKSVMKLVAPSLLNDYYSNLLDCSCNGMIALALGCSVYIWNSETQALVGHLDPSPQPGRSSDYQTQSISCLCWSKDGRALCVGTRRGDIQLWDVEQKQNMSCLPSHLSVVRALSWKQCLLSSGSVLGHIHHLDPRAPAPLVGAAVQKDGICSLQWSPGGDQLASGSTEGLLCIWDSDVTGLSRSRQPITAVRQPTAVKVIGWCPWQRKMIATGGGWRDGELRIWDTDSGICVTSANTNSQICSLRWAEQKRCLVTGHGLPQHHITCWSWDFPYLRPSCQLTGHSQRVLHLALNPDSTQIFSAGADQRFCIWYM